MKKIGAKGYYMPKKFKTFPKNRSSFYWIIVMAVKEIESSNSLRTRAKAPYCAQKRELEVVRCTLNISK